MTGITGTRSVRLVWAIISGWTIFMDLICAVTVTCRKSGLGTQDQGWNVIYILAQRQNQIQTVTTGLYWVIPVMKVQSNKLQSISNTFLNLSFQLHVDQAHSINNDARIILNWSRIRKYGKFFLLSNTTDFYYWVNRALSIQTQMSSWFWIESQL